MEMLVVADASSVFWTPVSSSHDGRFTSILMPASKTDSAYDASHKAAGNEGAVSI
jgi:hypothetical protein